MNRPLSLRDFSASSSDDWYTQMFFRLEAEERRESERWERRFRLILAEENRKRDALEAIRISFQNKSSANDVIISALQLEEEWKRDRRYSSKDIANVLKMAKSELFLRLNERRSDPSPRIAEFMNKRRTSYKFFQFSFDFSLFPTHSKQKYEAFVRQQLEETADVLQIVNNDTANRAIPSAPPLLTTDQDQDFFGGRMRSSHQPVAQLQFPTSTIKNNNIEGIEAITNLSVEIKDNYVCPISLSMMTDPVYILDDTTNYRFERSSITLWLSRNGTHPFTRAPIKVDSLVSDTALKQEINQFVGAVKTASFVVASNSDRV